MPALIVALAVHHLRGADDDVLALRTPLAVTLVLRSLLVTAVARDGEAGDLRAQWDEVI